VKVVSSQETHIDRCSTCRGRGWLNVHARPAYRPDVAKVFTAERSRELCWDCGGHGQEQAAA
jgi:DnaJ-class molecular chaperone